MKPYLSLIIWVAVIGTIFGLAWYYGYLVRLAGYAQETRDELRKCTWPTIEELKGSTVVVMVSILLLGVFTVFADFLIQLVLHWVM